MLFSANRLAQDDNIRQQAQAKARGYELTDDAMENAVDAAATLRAGSKFWTPKGDSWYNEIIAPSRANAGVKTYDRWNDRDSSTVQSHIEREIAKAGGTPEGTKIVVKNSNKIPKLNKYLILPLLINTNSKMIDTE